MSNYIAQAKDKATGEIVNFTAYDNYFGNRMYGYEIEGRQGVLNETQFDEEYTIVKNEMPTLHKKKPSDIFEGEGSSLYKTYVESVKSDYASTLTQDELDILVKNNVVTTSDEHPHDTIEEHIQCPICAQIACDKTSEDMNRYADNPCT